MATTILTRHEDGDATDVPANLAQGELAVNTQAGKLWVGTTTTPRLLLGGTINNGTADGQTLRWEADNSAWEANSDLIVADTGNVGIGTDAPAALLDVEGSEIRVRSRTSGTVGAPAAEPILSYIFQTNANTESAILGVNSFSSNLQSGLAFATSAGAGRVERMRIGSAGNVTVGAVPTGTNNATMVIGGPGGTVMTQPTGSGQLAVLQFAGVPIGNINDNGGIDLQGSVFGAGYGGKISALDVGGLIFGTRANTANWSERMRIDNGGNLLVGKTTAQTLTTPGHELRADGLLWTTNVAVCHVMSRTGNGPIDAYYVAATPSGGITITSGGTPTFYAGGSDARLKENITDREGALAEVMALRPVRFDWKDGSGSGEGFVAQEVEQVWPDCVVERPDDEYLTTAGLGVVETRLIKAIQELTARVEALEA